MKKLYYILALILAVLLVLFFMRNSFAEKYNQKGLTAYKAQNFADAEKYFNKALLWNKNSREINLNLAKTLFNLEKNDDCKAVLMKLSEIDNENPEYLAINGQILIRDKDFKEGINFLNKAIEKDSLLSYAYYYRGIAKANLNDLEGAAIDYTKAQELDASNIEALKLGTSIYVKLENFQASIDNYNKIIIAEPENTEAFFQRGTFKMKINDFKGAISDLSQAIVLSPDYGEAYFNRGKAYAQSNSLNEAISDFEKSVAKGFKIPASNYNIGLALLMMQKPDKAKGYLVKCANIIKDNDFADEAYQLLGTVEFMNNNFKKSIDLYNKSINLNPDNLETVYNRALAYSYEKDYKKAIDDLDFCLKKGLNKAEVYYARGIQKINLQDPKGGCSDLETALTKGYEAAREKIQVYCN